MIIWNAKSINVKLGKPIETFNILIKQCDHIVWSLEKNRN